MSPLRTAAPRKPGVGSTLQSSDAIAARLDDVERKIERLRALYESFFMGVERRPPVVPRTELNRLMLELQQVSIRNAALRFRFQSVAQRWTLLVTYWNRTLREIESGTYRRDLQKTYRRIAARVTKATIGDADVRRLERWIDELEEELPPLRHFILAGGNMAGAQLHLARAVCRRAERLVVSLGADAVSPDTMAYVNRLSDLLFVLARVVNHRAGVPEQEW